MKKLIDDDGMEIGYEYHDTELRMDCLNIVKELAIAAVNNAERVDATLTTNSLIKDTELFFQYVKNGKVNEE